MPATEAATIASMTGSATTAGEQENSRFA